MPRIEHEDWMCPACDARGDCLECGSLGTAEAYYKVQDLHAAAIQDENGTAARVLEHIELWPDDLPDRAYWIERMIQGARRQLRMEV